MSATSTPDLSSQLAQHIADLGHKHASVSYLLIGALSLFMTVAGVAGYLGLKAFDFQLARQEVKDAQYQQDRKTLLDTLTAHDTERAAQAVQIAQLEAQIKARDSKPLPKPVQEGLKPNANTEQVKNALETAYGPDLTAGTPKVEPDGNVALSLPQAQAALSAKVYADQTMGDLRDEKSINSLLNSANSSLTNDLGACKALNVQANKDIAGFKKLAVRSRWQKFLGGAEKVLIFGAGAYLGHKI